MTLAKPVRFETNGEGADSTRCLLALAEFRPGPEAREAGHPPTLFEIVETTDDYSSETEVDGQSRSQQRKDRLFFPVFSGDVARFFRCYA